MLLYYVHTDKQMQFYTSAVKSHLCDSVSAYKLRITVPWPDVYFTGQAQNNPDVRRSKPRISSKYTHNEGKTST